MSSQMGTTIQLLFKDWPENPLARCGDAKMKRDSRGIFSLSSPNDERARVRSFNPLEIRFASNPVERISARPHCSSRARSRIFAGRCSRFPTSNPRDFHAIDNSKIAALQCLVAPEISPARHRAAFPRDGHVANRPVPPPALRRRNRNPGCDPRPCAADEI